jgi:hypothetical protein
VNKKLEVISTIMLAFKSVFSGPIIFSKFFLKGLLIYYIAIEANGFLNGFIGTLRNPIVLYLTQLFLWFVLAPIGVALHRFIILGDELPAKPFKDFLSKRNVEFGFYGLLFSIPVAVCQLAPTIYDMHELWKAEYRDTWFWLISTPLLIYPYMFILVRVIIYLPFIAVEQKRSLADCWEITRGNNWRIFGANVVVGFTVYFVNKLLVIPITERAIDAVASGSYLAAFILDFDSALFLFVNYLLVVAVVSHTLNFFNETTVKEEKSLI